MKADHVEILRCYKLRHLTRQCARLAATIVTCIHARESAATTSIAQGSAYGRVGGTKERMKIIIFKTRHVEFAVRFMRRECVVMWSV
jgi:hypothetical protein